MKKNIILRTLLIFILFLIIITMKDAVYATGSFSISASSQTVNVGDTVTIYIKGNNAYGQVNITASNSSLSSSSVFLQNDTKQVTLVAKNAGTINVTATPGGSGLGDGDENPISGSKSLSINVKSASNPSNSGNNNNNSGNSGNSSNNGSTNNSGKTVKMITTSPTDFSGFKASNKGPYKVTVENNVSQLNVTVKYSDGSKKSYTKNLQEGSNKISVDGYTIIATRKTAEGEVIPNEIDDEETTDKEDEQKQKLRLDNLVLDDNLNAKLDPNFDSEVFEYTVILGNDYLDLKELYINALPNIDGAKVTIEGNKELTDGETTVTIKVEAEGYETVTYTIKVVKQEIVETEAEPVLEETDDVLDNSKELMKKRIIISSLVCLITFIGIIFIAKECYESTNNLKEKKNNKNRYNEDNDEEYINSKYEESKEENNILEDLYKIKNSEKELSIEKNGNNTEGNSNNNIQKEEQNEIENNNEKIENTEEKMDEFFSRNTRIEFSEGRTRRKHKKGKHS